MLSADVCEDPSPDCSGARAQASPDTLGEQARVSHPGHTQLKVHSVLLLSLSDSHCPSHEHTGRTGNPWHLSLEELHDEVIAPNAHAADN